MEPVRSAKGWLVYPVDPATGLKRCRKCQQEKPVSEFGRASAKARCLEGIRPRCRQCEGSYSSASWQGSNRAERTRRNIRRYGLSYEQYCKMFDAQDGLCAICRQPETRRNKGGVYDLAVDHDHSTGQVRGLLCHVCNTGLGKFRDDPALLLAAVSYLTERS